MENPTKLDVTNVKRIFRYIRGNNVASIMYKNGNDEELHAYCDSDFAEDEIDRKSISGYVIMYKGGTIAWATRKQQITVTSSTEAEFVSACAMVKELVYLKSFIENLTGKTVKATVYSDNQGAIQLIKNGIFNRRSKHIKVKFHYVCEVYQEKKIEIKYIPTDQQLADVFTKPLGSTKFETFKKQFLTRFK